MNNEPTLPRLVLPWLKVVDFEKGYISSFGNF
jgi:hypothetical protein